MLLILYGTSCSGKTEIIRHLVKFHEFQIIECYHTRKQVRKTDIARIRLSDDEFDEMVIKGELAFVNEQLNARYANKPEDFKTAVKSTERYVLDWPINKSEKLIEFEHIKIIIMPESQEQLTDQIKKAERTERLTEILDDYKTFYALEKLLVYENDGFHVVYNKDNRIKESVEEIIKITQNGDL